MIGTQYISHANYQYITKCFQLSHVKAILLSGAECWQENESWLFGLYLKIIMDSSFFGINNICCIMKCITFRRQRLSLGTTWKCQRSLRGFIANLRLSNDLFGVSSYTVSSSLSLDVRCSDNLVRAFRIPRLGAIHSHMWLEVLRSGHLVRIRVYRDRHFILNWRPKSRETFNGSQRGLSKSARSRSSSNPPETDPILKLWGHH